MLSLSVSEIHDTPRRLITETWARALRAIFPVECAACERRLTDDPVPFFCRTCWGQIRPLSGPACPRCDRPFPSPVASTYSPTHLCGDCRKRMPSFTKAWSFYPYDTPLREAIALLKYRGKYGMAPSLCCLLLAALPASLDVDVSHACPASSRSPPGTGIQPILVAGSGSKSAIGETAFILQPCSCHRYCSSNDPSPFCPPFQLTPGISTSHTQDRAGTTRAGRRRCLHDRDDAPRMRERPS